MTCVLRIYRAKSGQWSGIVFEDGEEQARIGGCESPGEVEDAARETWPGIEVEPSEDARAFWASFEGQPNTDERGLVVRVYRDGPHWAACLRRDGEPRFVTTGATRDEAVAWVRQSLGPDFDAVPIEVLDEPDVWSARTAYDAKLRAWAEAADRLRELRGDAGG